MTDLAAAPRRAGFPRLSPVLCDIIVGGAAFLGLFMVFVSFDAVEVLFEATREHEEWEFDELIASVPALCLVLAWFAYRRWRQVKILNGRLSETVARLEASIEKGRLMEGQLRETHKMEAMGKLAGGLAHELNNTLQPIVTLAQMAPADGPLAEPMRRILRSAKHGSDIVRRVLTFVSGDASGKETLVLSHALQDTIDFSTDLLASTVAVQTDFGDHDDCVYVSRTELTQVLTNLLTNAADAMAHKGTIAVGLETCHVDSSPDSAAALAAGDYCVITVSDDGPGMPPDVSQRVFDPFFTTKAAGEGTGLGLSVVYGIARDWGGKIAVESAPWQGACFKIFIPRAASRNKEGE